LLLINSIKLDKASGYDDIEPRCLKLAVPIIAYPISIILNHCFMIGIFPDKLKLAKVIPVFMKGSTNQLNNYRPISLLTSVSKIFERAI